MKYAVGVVGLGVMGRNLALNIAGKGFAVAGYDLDAAKRTTLSQSSDAKAISFVAAPDLLATALERPRKILMMVPAGGAVDDVMAHLRPHLGAGDVLVDGGNSFFRDTDRRCADLTAAGLHFVGAGVSGGEEGALRGPAIMPGGAKDGWDACAPIFRAIAAKADDGEPCVAYMGPRGAGHYVKMVHNGIEYGDMQLIAEIYHLFSRAAGMSATEIADVFRTWNEGELRSYLIEITAQVLTKIDADSGGPLVDRILDEAQQKGTGKWMSQDAFDLGVPTPTVNAAVEARLLSAFKQERVAASAILRGPAPHIEGDRVAAIDSARRALYASKIASYAQGFALMRHASREYGYDVDAATVAGIWRAGCIIRAALLDRIREAFRRDPAAANLMTDREFARELSDCQAGWRRTVCIAVNAGIPVPAIGASLAYYDAYRNERLPANLTQAQRDFFGAHTYRRVDRAGVFHTNWTEASQPS
jgi:6-phosphogluconate dehydrogenase